MPEKIKKGVDRAPLGRPPSELENLPIKDLRQRQIALNRCITYYAPLPVSDLLKLTKNGSLPVLQQIAIAILIRAARGNLAALERVLHSNVEQRQPKKKDLKVARDNGKRADAALVDANPTAVPEFPDDLDDETEGGDE